MFEFSSLRRLVPAPAKPILRKMRSTVLDSIRLALLQGTFSGSIVKSIQEKGRSKIESPLLDRLILPAAEARPYSPLQTSKVLSFIRSSAKKINQTSAILADEVSRELLKSLFTYRALGPCHVALPKATLDFYHNCYLAQSFRSAPSEHQFPPLVLGLYELQFENAHISIECWAANVLYTFIERQYYFTRDSVEIAPRSGDIVLDAGACFGDTALAFSATIGSAGKVYSFEPLPRQREIFERNLARNPNLRDRIAIHNYALDSSSGQSLTFIDEGAGARQSATGSVKAETLSIDDFVVSRGLPRVDFIKMDIEGAETPALKGATNTIRRFKPRLAISIYHSLDDLVSIPALIKSILPAYSIYIEHHTIYEGETVLYAGVA
jgi:FkbM family methyltransferase